MSKKPLRTTPDLALTSPVLIRAIENREETLWAWKRNVIDEFKELTNDEIREKLQATQFPFAVLVENLLGDFNFSSVIRNTNAFNGKAVFFIGDKRFDKRGTMGAENYCDVFWLPTIDSLLETKKKFKKMIAIDNLPGAIPLEEMEIVPDTLFVFGNEGVGITDAMREICDETVFVPQFGSVRSLNVACCSAIVLNHFVQKIQK